MKQLFAAMFMIFAFTKNTLPSEQPYNAMLAMHTERYDDDEDQWSQYEDAIELVRTFPENQNKKHIEKIVQDLKYTDGQGLVYFINEYNKHDLPIKKSFADLLFNTSQDNTTPKAAYYPTMRIETNMGEMHRLIFDPDTHQIIPLAIPPQPTKFLKSVKQPVLTAPNKPSIVAQLSRQTQSAYSAPIPQSAPTAPNKNITSPANTAPSLLKPQIHLIKKQYYTVQVIKNCLRLFGIDVDTLQQNQKKLLEFSQCVIGLTIIGAVLTYFMTQPGMTI